MENPLSIHYDPVSDTLCVDRRPPYAEQDSDLLDDDTLARFNPQTGDVETLELMHFRRRLESDQGVRLPVAASFQPLALE